jgi:hypothetical protein
MKRLIVALTLAGLFIPATFAVQDTKDATKTEKKKKKVVKKKADKKTEEKK